MKNLIQSLAKARKNFGGIRKNGEASITTKSGYTYKYNYATLDDITAATSPALADEGLITYHTYEIRKNPELGLTQAVIAHVTDGETELTTTVELPLNSILSQQNPAQALGSILTYGRRYSISGLLNINTGEDDDAQGAVEKDDDQPRSPVTPVAPVNDLNKQQQDWLRRKFDEFGVGDSDREKIAGEAKGKTMAVILSEIQAAATVVSERQQTLDRIHKKIEEEYLTVDQKRHLEGKLKMSLESIKNIPTMEGLIAVFEVINSA